jgi:hypothetical protein
LLQRAHGFLSITLSEAKGLVSVHLDSSLRSE